MTTGLQQDLAELRESSGNIQTVLEQEIVKSGYMIGALANVLEEGLVILNRRHQITVMNTSAGDMLGKTPADSLGKDLSYICPPPISSDLLSIHREWTILDSVTGLPRYLDVTISRIDSLSKANRDEDSPEYILTMRDVTFKKSSEFRVADLSSFQHTLIESLPVPTFYTNRTGGYIRGSQSFFEAVGINRARALTMTVEELFSPSVAQRFRDLRVKVDIIRCKVATPSGDKNFVLYKGLLKSAEGQIIGLIGSLVDLDHCKIDNVSDLVLKAIEICPDPIALLYFPAGEILYTNKAFTEEFGYTRKESLGMNASEMFSSKVNLHGLRTEVLPRIRKHEVSRIEIHLKNKSGECKVSRLVVLPISKTGQSFVHYCMIVRES